MIQETTIMPDLNGNILRGLFHYPLNIRQNYRDLMIGELAIKLYLSVDILNLQLHYDLNLKYYYRD